MTTIIIPQNFGLVIACNILAPAIVLQIAGKIQSIIHLIDCISCGLILSF